MPHPSLRVAPCRYASILVPVDLLAACEARVTLAADLSDRFESRLIGCAAQPIAAPFYFEPVGSGVTTIAEIEERQALEILAKAKDRFIRVAGSNDRVEWRQELGFATDTVLQQARAADLVVTSRPSLNDAGSDADPGELLMRAARPILFVPPGIDHVSAKHIIVGWKDTREARRAVIDALPLLARAQEVTVLSVGSEDSGATDVAAYLGYHAIVALAVNRTIADEEAAEEILRLAEAKAADLIVCGGYGHSRAREWVFGGATRTLLYSSARCCLMTH